MKEVQFKDGEKRMVTDRAALQFAAKGLLKKNIEVKEEKKTLETKEIKTVTKKK
jgi:hypothetical protein